jgi:hypothetical protein
MGVQERKVVFDLNNKLEDRITICKRKDCQLNSKGQCFAIKEETVLKNGTRHHLDLSECPFYKRKGVKE